MNIEIKDGNCFSMKRNVLQTQYGDKLKSAVTAGYRISSSLHYNWKIYIFLSAEYRQMEHSSGKREKELFEGLSLTSITIFLLVKFSKVNSFKYMQSLFFLFILSICLTFRSFFDLFFNVLSEGFGKSLNKT